MDTSEEYIKMCRKAKEIQELWEPNYFDRVYVATDYHTEMDRREEVLQRNLLFWEGKTAILFRPDCIVTEEGRWIPEDKIFWLPRQDQLQEMIDWSNYRISIEKFGSRYRMVSKNLTKNFWEEDLFYYETMEQLWLAFVMHEKYNKKWNGTDWE